MITDFNPPRKSRIPEFLDPGSLGAWKSRLVSANRSDGAGAFYDASVSARTFEDVEKALGGPIVFKEADAPNVTDVDEFTEPRRGIAVFAH